jgi:hypothetical protein
MRPECPRRIDERIDSLNPAAIASVSSTRQAAREDVMSRISRTRWLLANAATMLMVTGHAHASQGPGTTPGTAGAFTQMMMAIVVYGLCGAAIVIGAIGTFRKN